jgi:hypothetical protein
MDKLVLSVRIVSSRLHLMAHVGVRVILTESFMIINKELVTVLLLTTTEIFQQTLTIHAQHVQISFQIVNFARLHHLV